MDLEFQRQMVQNVVPFSYSLLNYTFNENLIPHSMKEFQQQTREFAFTNPLTPTELENMIANTESVIPNFELDSINDTAHRFEKLKVIYENKKEKFATAFTTTSMKNILRNKKKSVTTTVDPAKRMNANALNRAFDLMTQFVYAARYKLTYGQALRLHYKSTLEYKIGYCFALMRDIRQQQLALFSTMHYNYKQHVENLHGKKTYKSFADIASYFQLYEKIVKLDVDMKDVVAVTQELMDKRWIPKRNLSHTTDAPSTDNSVSY
ncbi:uncharacterized protein LOC133532072 isoform X2 [Cydia pomonella]|uniref:uncharacterized protein LOC133532072 isoform X2 n=1 Tax=Cydia pomonella TaxID=82600 RepID=UPI002ADE2F0A|nr:uncharacterized protein LOC133532072 isoform X2 [Cydia pomonella]